MYIALMMQEVARDTLQDIQQHGSRAAISEGQRHVFRLIAGRFGIRDLPASELHELVLPATK